MLSLFLLILFVCAACITVGIVEPKAWPLIALGGSVLVYVVGWLVWVMLWWFQVVRLDELFAKMGLYRIEGGWAQIALFGPPLLPVVVFNWLFIFIRRRKRKRSLQP